MDETEANSDQHANDSSPNDQAQKTPNIEAGLLAAIVTLLLITALNLTPSRVERGVANESRDMVAVNIQSQFGWPISGNEGMVFYTLSGLDGQPSPHMRSYSRSLPMSPEACLEAWRNAPIGLLVINLALASLSSFGIAIIASCTSMRVTLPTLLVSFVGVVIAIGLVIFQRDWIGWPIAMLASLGWLVLIVGAIGSFWVGDRQSFRESSS